MDSMLQGIYEVCYIVDIIMGKTNSMYFENLEKVLQCLFVTTWCTCEVVQVQILVASVNFLGHRVDAEKIHTTED